MNRRNILSSLATGAGALWATLLSPLAAWAGKRRELDPAAMAHGNWQAAERECQMLREAHTGKVAEVAELRALLAEARETIRHDPFHDSEHFLARIDQALKGKTNG